MSHTPVSSGAIAKSSGRLLFVRALALLLVVLICSGGLSAYSVLTHYRSRSSMGRCDPAPPDQAIPWTVGRPDPGGACLRLRRRSHPGPRLLPIRVVENSAISCTTFAAETLSASCCAKANEYAFALGALSHYASDIAGHPAVNQSVAIEYPKLRAKFGKSVRYAQDKTAH